MDEKIIYEGGMLQCVLQPALFSADDEYASQVNLLNHNTALAYNSGATAIAVSSSISYYIRIPTPFPRQGFWFGALKNKSTLRLRINTSGAFVAAGTGTVVFDNSNLQLINKCLSVPPDEYSSLEKRWSARKWRSLRCIVNEPNSTTLVAAGDCPKVQLQTMKGNYQTNNSFI